MRYHTSPFSRDHCIASSLYSRCHTRGRTKQPRHGDYRHRRHIAQLQRASVGLCCDLPENCLLKIIEGQYSFLVKWVECASSQYLRHIIDAKPHAPSQLSVFSLLSAHRG
jgi:hypothetical protein